MAPSIITFGSYLSILPERVRSIPADTPPIKDMETKELQRPFFANFLTPL